MPVLVAIFIATSIAWIIKDALPAPAGVPLPLMIALVAWLVVFTLAKRFLTNLRPGE